MKELEEAIIKRCLDIQMQEYEDETEYKYFKNIVKYVIEKNNFSKSRPSAFFLALAKISNPDVSFKDIFNDTKKIEKNLDLALTAYPHFINYLNALYTFKKGNVLEDLMKYKEYSPKILKNEKITKAIDKITEIKSTVDAIKTFYFLSLAFFPKIEKRNHFINLFIKYSDTDLFINYGYLLPKFSIQENKNHILPDDIPREIKRQMQRDIKNYSSPNKKYKEILMIISNHQAILEREKDRFIKSNKRKSVSYMKLLDKLKRHPNNKVIIIDQDMEKSIEDEKIRQKFYQYVIKHNQNIYNNLKNENDNCSFNKVNMLEQLFIKYQISLSLLKKDQKEQIVEKNTLDNLESILRNITSSSLLKLLNNSKILFTICMLDSYKKLNQIIDFYQKAILDESFLEEYLCDIINNHDAYENFIKNIDTLLDIHLDILKISISNPELLLKDNQIIKTNIDIIKLYQLDYKNMNYRLFYDLKIFDYIDLFIELGLHSWIRENLMYLDSNMLDIVKRIKITQTIQDNIMDKDGNIKENILSGKNFYIKKDDLDEYIEDLKLPNQEYQNTLQINSRDQILEDEITTIIDQEFKKDQLHYQIDNIIISRIKFLRNINTLKQQYGYIDKEMILHAMIYPSLISSGEYQTIKLNIDNITHLNSQKTKTFML